MAKKISLILFLIGTSLLSHGQFADSLKSRLIKDWIRSKLYTLDYLKTMPAEKYDFRPQDSIRTFGQQMIHIAQGTVSLMEAATGSRIPGIINRQHLETVPAALSKDSVTFFITLSYNYAIEALKGFNMDSSCQYVRRGNFYVTRLGWILKAYEHQAHHRGQTAIYIRTAGLKPPDERLFDD